MFDPQPSADRGGGLKILVPIVLGLAGFVVFITLNASGPPAQIPSVAAVPVFDASAFARAYAENELAGDAAHKGHIVRVVGVVGSVANDILGHPYVTLGEKGELGFCQVQCMLDRASVDRAIQLKAQDRITVQGKVEGFLLNVILKECSIQSR